MTVNEIFFLVFAVLGGLALFIFGMNVMTDGLKNAAGSSLRTILSKTSRNKLTGLVLGTFLGLLVHSSATTVMLVGFVNAGLMRLVETIPPMLGCNIGTTISMQVISFKLDEYCFFAITIGFILQMVSPNPKTKQIGRALLGFGLLFLGMKTMSGAIRPHREALAPLLTRIDGTTTPGMLIGVLISLSITGVIQSSGATIGMCFALINAGVFTELTQVYPIVLGAHIGTCATAMLGSLGTNIEARRTAVAHLLFNIMNVIMAVAAAPFFLWLVTKTSSDLVRQTANLHTIVMCVAVALVLPMSVLHAKLVTFVVRSKKPPPQPSFLDNAILGMPEQAIMASVKELQRVARICYVSLRLNADLFFKLDSKRIRAIKINESVVNDIKLAMKDYLTQLTSRYLSRRQAILIHHLERCISNIERIGDHIDRICDLSIKRNNVKEALVDAESFDALFELYKSAMNVLQLVIDSLDPEQKNFQDLAKGILGARDDYKHCSIDVKAMFTNKLASREMQPYAGFFYGQYIAAFDRIVKHSKTIALVESQPQFWIKRRKLEHVATEADEFIVPELVDPNDYLDQLQSEDYL